MHHLIKYHHQYHSITPLNACLNKYHSFNQVYNLKTTTNTTHTQSIHSQTRRKVPRRSNRYFNHKHKLQQNNQLQQSTAEQPIIDIDQSHYKYVKQLYQIKQKYSDLVKSRTVIPTDDIKSYKSTVSLYNQLVSQQRIVLPNLDSIVVQHQHNNILQQNNDNRQQFADEIVAKQRTLAIYDNSLDHSNKSLHAFTNVYNQSDYIPLIPTGNSFVVFQVNNQQVKCSTNDLIMCNKLKAHTVGDTIQFKNILLLGSTSHTIIGRPYILNAVVECTVEESTYTDKILIFKMRRRKNSRSLQGYRSQVMFLRINKIIYPSQYNDIQPVQYHTDNNNGNVIDTMDDADDEDTEESMEEQLADDMTNKTKL